MGIRRFTSSSSNSNKSTTSSTSSGSKSSSLYSSSKQFVTRAAQNLQHSTTQHTQQHLSGQIPQNFQLPGAIYGQPSQSNGFINIASSSNSSGASDQNSNVDMNPQNPVAILQQRIQILEAENRRVMSNQGRLIGESNRRLDMHLSEIRTLKEEVRSLQGTNEELRRQCQHSEEERLKAQRLGQEWERFGKYSNELMKQEIRSYQVRVGELEAKKESLLSENADLKRLCLYLDEQRQSLIQSLGASRETFFPQSSDELSTAKNVANSEIENSGETSEDAGCGSSAASSNSGCEDSPQEAMKSEFCKQNVDLERECNGKRASVVSINQEQERAIRSITNQVASTSITDQTKENNGNRPYSQNILAAQNQRVFDYIHSLENRIRQLEQLDKRPLSPIPTTMMSSFERECRSASPSISASLRSKFTRFNFDRNYASIDVLHKESTEDLTENTVILPLGSQRPESCNAAKLAPVKVLSELPLSPWMPRFLRMGLSRLGQESGSAMFGSMTNSSMTTSSGTAYCSSSEDAESDSTATTILVVGDEAMDNSAYFNNNLEVRPLGTIQEEDRDETDTEENCWSCSEFGAEKQNDAESSHKGQNLQDSLDKEKLEVETARAEPNSKPETDLPQNSPDVFVRTRRMSQNEMLSEEKKDLKNQNSANRISSSSTGSAFSASSTFSSCSGTNECESPDLDLPPRMPPLILESKRFSLCSNSNVSDSISNGSGSNSSLNKFVRMPTKVPFSLNSQVQRCPPPIQATAQYLLRQQSPRPERKLFMQDTHSSGAKSGPPPVPTRIRIPPPVISQPNYRGMSSFQTLNVHLQTFRSKEFETIQQNGNGFVKPSDVDKQPIWQTAWSSLDRKGTQVGMEPFKDRNQDSGNSRKFDIQKRAQAETIEENNFVEARFTSL
ncbi:CCDC85 family domain-containing protein [Ditylenchus destructor]|nr:CCDC85 family domain-containing protein [Ditylenchus destructor]